jgi:hypothetical protein
MIVLTIATLSDVLLHDDAFSPNAFDHTYHQFFGFFISTVQPRIDLLFEVPMQQLYALWRGDQDHQENKDLIAQQRT